MTLSDYELRVLREMEAEFAPRPGRLRRCPDRCRLILLALALVLIVTVAVTLGIAVAAPAGVGCALLGGVAAVSSRRRRAGSGL
jgi:hypothetical protein